MWLVRAVLRLAGYVATATAVAIALAAIQAPLRHHGFLHGFWLSCYVVGFLYVMLDAVGGSSFARISDARSRGSMLGRVPGGATWSTLTRAQADEPQLTVTAVLLASGAALIALGLLLQVY